MNALSARAELAGLMSGVTHIADAAQRTFGSLNATQLNWQPSPGEWSVAQCLEHVMLVNAAYVPLLERIARGEWRPTLKERLPLLPKLFGRIVLNAVQPDATRTFKARPKFQPTSGAIGGDVMTGFAAHQQELRRYMDATTGCDWYRTIITSPVVSFMTYSLYDAYRIIVTHERHHLGQAERVLVAREFPRASADATVR